VAQAPCELGLLTHRDHRGGSGPGAVVLATLLGGAKGRRGGNWECRYEKRSLRTATPISGCSLPFLQLVRVGAEPGNRGSLLQRVSRPE